MTDQPDDLDTPVSVREMLESGATFRQLDYWYRRGFFTHPGQAAPVAPGSGYNRGWTRRELAIASLTIRMIGARIDVAQAAEWARDAVDAGRTEVTTDTGITVAWGDVA